MHLLWLISAIAFAMLIYFIFTGGCNSSLTEGFKGGCRGGSRRHHGGGYNRWRGRNQSIWWNTPLYYVNIPYNYDINEDPCNCYGRYKNAIDSGISQETASSNLVGCVDQTLRGGPCI